MSYYTVNNRVSITEIHRKYLFRKKLGKGSFCDVFLAENRFSGEMVAIKMMKKNSCTESIERRVASFRREAMLYGQLDHQNIIKVLDSGETDTGLLYIAFEYVKGKTLAELLKKEGKLSIPRTINLMRQILSGLNEAHIKDIIHRDLKPENIMVIPCDYSEKIKIIDFGISAFANEKKSDSFCPARVKEFIGTPLYAAPEQLRGEQVSAKADIYAWGLLFLECITGKSPFSGETVAAIVQQQLAPSPVPVPAALINHQLGILLCWILEKNVRKRVADTRVIASYLEKISTDDIPQYLPR